MKLKHVSADECRWTAEKCDEKILDIKSILAMVNWVTLGIPTSLHKGYTTMNIDPENWHDGQNSLGYWISRADHRST